jgi:3-oxoacyl-[acyl-carrier-protein] synthase-3
MTQRTTAAITAIDAYLPPYILTNFELEKMVDTSDEWIRTRTGIHERRLLKIPGWASSDMAAEAIKKLLDKTGINPLDIEVVVCCTVTPDMVFPATANIISDKAGLKNAWGFDLTAACSGFLYGLQTGASYIESGRYKKVLVVGVDVMSSIIDYTDRNTCIIFGDGCGVALLEPNYEGYGIMDSILKSDGSGRVHLHQKAGGSLKPATIETVTNKEHFVYQEGQPVFKAAVKGMADVSYEIMEKNNLKAENIQWLVPHQANLRIIDATRERMGLDPAKVMVNIQRYGNTTDATIPLCLFDYEKQLNKGDNLILAAFGGGYTWGSIWVKWAYDTR